MHHSPAMTIILPFQAEIQPFEDTLASVLRYLPAQTQVVVVHDGSYQNPHDLDEVDFVVSAAHATLGEQLGTALRVAEAPLIGVVRPGIEMDENWHESIFDAFEDRQVASVSPAIVDVHKPNRLVVSGVEASKSLMRKLNGVNVRLGRKAAKLRPLGPTSWAAFYRRSVLDQLGTPDGQLESLYLDLDLALGVRQLGLRCEFLQDCVFTADDPSIVLQEAAQPHGCASARAKTRFGQRTSTFGESLVELLASPFKPWYVKHVLGKFSARSMRDIDQAYRRRLVQKKVELQEAEAGRSDILPLPTGQQESYRRVA